MRCPWAKTDLAIAYHDAEWGVPSFDDRHLFEHLALETAQAGLSWDTVLKKRDRYREVFAGFDPAAVARFTPADVDRLLGDPGIIRNRQKIEATVKNAGKVLEIQSELGTFAAYLWHFVGGEPRVNAWEDPAQVPAFTRESEALSRDMKARGFAFAGPTGLYALMQSVGMVNDHLVSCPRRKACGAS